MGTRSSTLLLRNLPRSGPPLRLIILKNMPAKQIINTVKVESLLTALNSCRSDLQIHTTSADFNMFMSGRYMWNKHHTGLGAYWLNWEQETATKEMLDFHTQLLVGEH